MCLKLVPEDRSIEMHGLISDLQDLLDDHMECFEARPTGNCLVWDVANNETGNGVRIVFDPQNLHLNRQGIHRTIDMDGSELCDVLDQANSDGFNVVWVHLKF